MREYVIAKYLRLSLEDTKTDSMSLENQRLLTERHIASLDESNTRVLEFVDNGYSGTNFERPGVQELLELVRSGAIDCVIVKDFSRFGRNMLETGYFIEQVFPLFHTRFISVSDGFDSNDYKEKTGGIDVALKFLAHEHYSRDLSRKIKSAKHERMKRGELQSKYCVFGYVKGKDGRLAIDEPAAETVRLIFTLAVEGKSLSFILKHLYDAQKPTPGEYKKKPGRLKNVAAQEYSCLWEKSVILSILSEEQYLGTYIAGKTRIEDIGSGKQIPNDESQWIRIPGHHPAIIDRALFDKAREMIDRKGEPLRKRKIGTYERYSDTRNRPLNGKVSCGSCGHAMTLSSTRNAAYHCRYTIPATDAECHRLRVLASELENVVYEIICKQAHVILGIGKLSDIERLELQTARQAEFEKRIAELDNNRCALYERFIVGEIGRDEYKAAKNAIDAEYDRLLLAHTALREETRELSAKKDSADNLQKLAGDALAPDGLTRALVDLLVDKVYIFPDDRIEIKWKVSDFASDGT